MNPSTRPVASVAAPSRVGMAATLVLAAIYCVALHLLIVDATTRSSALLLITAPWLLAAASTATKAARARLTGLVPAIAIVVMVGIAAVLAAWGVWRLGQRLGRHADLLIFAESLVFLLSLAMLFAASLRNGREALVTRLARSTRRGDMTPAIVRYTRRVTAGWALFLTTAAAISAVLFALQSRELWSAFVNLALWPLTAIAFAVEYLIRIRVLPGIEHTSPLGGVQGFMRRDDVGVDSLRERAR